MSRWWNMASHGWRASTHWWGDRRLDTTLTGFTFGAAVYTAAEVQAFAVSVAGFLVPLLIQIMRMVRDKKREELVRRVRELASRGHELEAERDYFRDQFFVERGSGRKLVDLLADHMGRPGAASTGPDSQIENPQSSDAQAHEGTKPGKPAPDPLNIEGGADADRHP